MDERDCQRTGLRFPGDRDGRAGYTWSVNSRENRLTPWSNDAVSDPPGEAIYLRDEETGTVWTPTPLPIREAPPYVIRHGQGYTIFEHTSMASHRVDGVRAAGRFGEDIDIASE